MEQMLPRAVQPLRRWMPSAVFARMVQLVTMTAISVLIPGPVFR
jgi:hypothetical protein